MKEALPNQPYVGGQAVIEGVMMRSPNCLAIAVRRADGSIVVRDDAWVSIWERLRFLRWPFFRGSVVLAESVYNGVQAIHFAARQAEEDDLRAKSGTQFESSHDQVRSATASLGAAKQNVEERARTEGGTKTQTEAVAEAEAAPGAGVGDGAEDRAGAGATLGVETVAEAGAKPTSSSSEPRSNMAFTIALAFVFAIGLFVGLPHLLAFGAGHVAGHPLDVDSFAFHALDGFFKILVFVGYIAAIGTLPDIRRVFEYHGAEHKVVNAYEKGLPVDLENARRQTTFHARCGTSFVLFVLLLSIFLFAAVFPFVPVVSEHTLVNHLAMIVLKIPLMLPLAGIAYEINRYAAAHPGQLWVQLVVRPGKLMQRLTTREPSDDQLEIALTAMHAALCREREARARVGQPTRAGLGTATSETGRVLTFRDYGEAAASTRALT